MVSQNTCKARVLFLRSNPIAPDPRVEKEATSLAKSGYRVMLLGWDRTASFPLKEAKDFGTIFRIRARAYFGKGLRNLPSLLKWQVFLLLWLWRHRQEFDVIHACDFDTVLPALVIARLFRKKLVYDIFDFYADMLRNTPNFLKRIIRKIDLWVINKADAVILADAARQEQIRGSTLKRLEVIYNSPVKPDNLQDQEEVADKNYRLRIAYVGLLQVERGLLEMLKVVGQHPDWHLDLAGFGGDEPLILSAASELSNVTFHGRVPYETALQLMAKADVLFATYDPRIPNHRYSSPNKVFEAMMLGKPIIVARGMGTDRLVEKYNLGFVVEYGNILELEQALSTVARWTIIQKKQFALRAREVFTTYFSWDKMEERLLKVYEKLLSQEGYG